MQALEDPNGFLKQYRDGAIFDEVQEIPSLLSYLLPFLESLIAFSELAKRRVPKSVLIYGGEAGQMHTTTLLPWQKAAEALDLVLLP